MNHEASLDGITFCIPNWNHRDYLPRSVGSALRAVAVLRAMNVPSEIVVVDDASRDGSYRLLLALAAVHDAVDVHVLAENGGLAAARNRVLRAASYSHVCFLDADNALIPENIGVFVRAAAETGAGVVYGNLIRHDGRRVLGLLSNDYVNDALYEGNYIDALTICARDALLGAGGFDEALTSHEDWEMWLHLIAENVPIVFVPVCMSYYYVNPHSMVQTTVAVDHSRFRRIFDQRRTGLPLGWSERRMYHPDVGWLR